MSKDNTPWWDACVCGCGKYPKLPWSAAWGTHWHRVPRSEVKKEKARRRNEYERRRPECDCGCKEPVIWNANAGRWCRWRKGHEVQDLTDRGRSLNGRDILVLRLRENGATYDDIADRIGVSRQRAHQIHAKAEDRIKRETRAPLKEDLLRKIDGELPPERSV